MSTPESQLEGGSCPHLRSLYNPFAGPQLKDPYPVYAQARREEPIFFSEVLQAWVVTCYDDIRSVLLQPDIFSSRDTMHPTVPWAPEALQILAASPAVNVPTFISNDGKEHQRFRTPLNRAFLPARLKGMEGMVRIVANSLVDAFCEQGHTDLVASFAGPLPQEIILRMFGIPMDDLAKCKRWSDHVQALINEPLSVQQQAEYAQSMVAFHQYMTTLIEQRKENPGDDVISILLAESFDQDRPLTMPETVVTLTGVLIAGHETTTSLIGTAVYLLLSRPEYWQWISEHPAGIPTAVEEILRFDAPVPAFYRTGLQETQVGGVTIPEGALLSLVFASANRDEARFVDAEQFQLSRTPNQHLAFGHGVHFCVGAPLARIEGRIALEVLSQRLLNLRLQPQQDFSYTPNLMLRGLKHLEVTWDV